MDVWVLWHIPPDAGTHGDSMLIGVYSTRDAAIAAVHRLADQPGFADYPEMVEETDTAGFLVEAYTLNQDHWTEGYVTEPG